MSQHRIYTMKFASVYPLYVQKAERKGRTKGEVDTLICWLTAYDAAGLQEQINKESTFEEFFSQAPALNPRRTLITRGMWRAGGGNRGSADAESALPGQTDRRVGQRQSA